MQQAYNTAFTEIQNESHKLQPFWRSKTLAEMTNEEWESLCDGCGRCCLKKLEDEVTGQIAYTDVACRLLDRKRCRCRHYDERLAHVPDCVQLETAATETFAWLPVTCAYRKLAEGRPLSWWHPLVSGNPDTVHRAGISVRGRVLGEDAVAAEDLETRVIRWIKTAPLRRG
jgi:uncharacterized cysteine cluster protein YcgN (CxxCxxCC family)